MSDPLRIIHGPFGRVVLVLLARSLARAPAARRALAQRAQVAVVGLFDLLAGIFHRLTCSIFRFLLCSQCVFSCLICGTFSVIRCLLLRLS